MLRVAKLASKTTSALNPRFTNRIWSLSLKHFAATKPIKINQEKPDHEIFKKFPSDITNYERENRGFVTDKEFKEVEQELLNHNKTRRWHWFLTEGINHFERKIYVYSMIALYSSIAILGSVTPTPYAKAIFFLYFQLYVVIATLL